MLVIIKDEGQIVEELTPEPTIKLHYMLINVWFLVVIERRQLKVLRATE